MRSYGSVIIAGALAALACSTPTVPGLISSTYALTLVDGSPVPQRVGSETHIADTIRLEGDDWSRVQVVRLHAEWAPEGPVRRESDGFVTGSGSRIVLDFVCPPNALCIPPDTLRPAGAGLTRQSHFFSGDPEERSFFVYEPVTPPGS